MGRECPTNEEFGPGWGHVWVKNNPDAPRKGCPMGRECPTNEEFGPGGVTYG